VTVRQGVWAVVTDLWRDGRGWVLVVVSAGQFLSIGIRVVFPALLPRTRDEFLLTNTTAGVLVSLLWVSFATAQLPGEFPVVATLVSGWFAWRAGAGVALPAFVG